MIDPRIIPLSKKQKFLKTFTEENFRDKVVRPLFLMKGLVHGKDICGPDEDGKDCYFWGSDPIRGRILYAVQTKRGDLKLSANAKDNVHNAATQLATALNTPVKDSSTRHTIYPDCVILAASGEINKKAQTHITNEVKDRRIVFLGSDELIVDIDKLMPELWYSIDVKRLPYLRRLREHLINHTDTIDVSQLGVVTNSLSPVTDEAFVQIYLYRYGTKPTKNRGKIEQKLDYIEMHVQDTLKLKETVVLITGEAGAGKITCLRRLAMLLVQQALVTNEATPLPVCLNAVDVINRSGRLVDIAAEATQRVSSEATSAFDSTDLENGNLVLLLDAFDEIGSSTEQKILLDKIKGFVSDYPSCRLLLTSRDHPSVRQAVDSLNFVRFHISPISVDQAKKMIDRLSKGKSLEPEATQEILRRLDNIHGLELNPLLVTIFVATTDYARTDIPANITELFKKFTELMLGRWDQSKGLAQQYQAQVKDFLLSRIGFTIHSRHSVSLSLDECRTIINHDLLERGLAADVDVLFDEIVYRSGLLKVEDQTVSFRHHLIQEFFAGRGINNPEFLRQVVAEYWWMRATVFYFGDRPSEGVAIQKLEANLDNLTGTDLYQAAVTIGTAIQACYLSKTNDKKVAMEWVIHSMANTMDECLNFFGEPRGKLDSMRMVKYYIYGRDAVATKAVEEIADVLAAEMSLFDDDQSNESRRLHDLCMFWCIAGLIESRNLEKALQLLKKYRPRDFRLFLALDMGAAYVEHSHTTNPENKRVAKSIRALISPKLAGFRAEVMNEMKSMLLEVRSLVSSEFSDNLVSLDAAEAVPPEDA